MRAQSASKSITDASVPADPDAPGPQPGTVPDTLPFSEPLSFTRRDTALKVLPFHLSQVRLLPGSPFFDAQQSNRALLHKLPAERLLYNFHLNAGLSSKAQPLGGWEKPDCELRGHYVGHYLSACALAYASTGDPELKQKASFLTGELAKCQSQLSSGYLSAFPTELFDRLRDRKRVWAPFYTVHKIMAGLLDTYQLCGDRQAFEVLTRMADWTGQWTGAIAEDHMQMVLDTEYGGMNEVLYNLATITNEPRYAAVGDRFTKQRFFNPLALRRDQLRGLHTNTHIPQVIGAARRYEISSDPRFHDVADYFWDEVVGARSYVTGGTSNNEGWLVEPNHQAQELSLGSDTNECCCAYNMLKLTRQLYTWTADPRYFDYYERVLYNHRLGTIDPQIGETQYYLGLVPGSWRTFATVYDSFWCCNGTGIEEYSKLPDSIYFHDASTLYVNLFIPSELEWAEKGIRLRQTNKFPEDPSTLLTIQQAPHTPWALHIRIPSWVSGLPTVKINGKLSEISASPGSYLTILRSWKPGDHVELHLPMNLRNKPMPDNPSIQAVLYGPTVLATELPSDPVPATLISGHEGPKLAQVPKLEMPSLKASQITKDRLVPFNTIPAGRRYSVYLNVG